MTKNVLLAFYLPKKRFSDFVEAVVFIRVSHFSDRDYNGQTTKLFKMLKKNRLPDHIKLLISQFAEDCEESFLRRLSRQDLFEKFILCERKKMFIKMMKILFKVRPSSTQLYFPQVTILFFVFVFCFRCRQRQISLDKRRKFYVFYPFSSVKHINLERLVLSVTAQTLLKLVRFFVCLHVNL